MRAMIVREVDGVRTLVSEDVDEPVPSAGQVLVRACASGVNRADLLQRRGKYSQPALVGDTDYTIAGMEIAGVVAAVGAGIVGVAVGDRVMAMCGGSYAELALVDRRLVLAVPDAISWAMAAALPVATMTAFNALAQCARLAPSETVLITAATSTVGLITIQVAHLLGAGRVIATTRSADKAPVLTEAGADAVAVGDGAELAQAIASAAPSTGVDVVVDHVGAPVFPALLAAMARGGRYVSVGRLGGQRTELDLNAIARDRLTLLGTSFRTRSIEQYADIAAGVRETVLPAIVDGRVRARTASSFALHEANQALDSLTASDRSGKITLSIGSGA